MRVFFKSILLVGIVAFSSCSKDDGEETTTTTPVTKTPTEQFNEDIIGKWRLTQLDRENGTTVVTGGNPTSLTFYSIGRDFSGDIEFMSDSTTNSGYGYNYDETISHNGGTPGTTSHDRPTNNFAGTFEVLSTTELETSSIDGINRIYQVSNLTATTMTLKTAVVEHLGPSSTNFDLVVSLKKK